MRLVHLPSFPPKNLDTITHSFLASLACIVEKPDIVHIHGTGNSIYALVPRLRGIPTVVQSHGLDWQRAKWGKLARAYLKMTDYTTVHFPDVATAVSRKMQKYYQDKFQRSVMYIPNGVEHYQRVEPQEILRYGLKGNDYIFFAARLVPEKGCHYLIKAYEALGVTNKKLVIAGDSSYGDAYAEELKKSASDRVLFARFRAGPLVG